MNHRRNTALLLALTLVVSGIGYYVTGIHQPAEVERLESMRRISRHSQGEVAQLLAEAEASADRAEAAARKWNARYRVVPDRMKTPDIVEYLEGITSRGFEAFDIRLEDIQTTPDVSTYTLDVNGTAYYSSLYDFIWEIENRPAFYRIRDLEMARTEVRDARGEEETVRDMVRFTMKLDAYFNGIEGMSADEAALTEPAPELLPVAELPHNSFYPLVKPPRETGGADDRLDVESAALVSIAGNRAIFQDGDTQYIVYDGTSVAGGVVTKIDPVNLFVRARLTKDGVTESVDIRMEAATPSYRQARGNTQLVPLEAAPGGGTP
jgi:hypothetical protein